MDEPDDMSSDGDDIDDADVDDGVLNFVGENLFVVQEATVCNNPLCSLSERGVRCCDVDLDAIKNKQKFEKNKKIEIEKKTQLNYYLLVIAMT